jgi:hypothetical protein
MKVAKASIASSSIGPLRPRRSMKPAWNFLKAATSSKVPLLGFQQPEIRRCDLERSRDGLHRTVRIAEVPGQAVEVAEDVATGTGGIPVARSERRVVEEPAPGHHARRLGIVHGHVLDLRARDRIDDHDRVVEAGQRVEAVLVFLEHQAGEAAAGHLDLVGGARRERVVLQGLGVEDADPGRAECGDVKGSAVARHRHLLGEGEALAVLGVRDRVAADGVIDVFVEVPWGDAPTRAEDGDPALVEVAADAVAGEEAGPFETFFIPCLGVRDVDLAIHRVHHHVVEDGADALVRAGRAGELCRRIGVGVDHEDVLVGQGEEDLGVPGPVELVDPMAAVEPDDEPRFYLPDAVGVGVGPGQPPRGLPAVRDERFVDGRGAVAGVERRRVDLAAVRAHRQGARRIAEQGDDGERRSRERVAEMIRVENPDVRPAHAGNGELGVVRHVLAAVRGGDEGTVPSRPAENDVARLISHQQGAHDPAAVAISVQRDHAHAVREVIDDPDLVVVARRHGHRLEADGNGGAMLQAVAHDAEDFETAVGCVGREEELARRRQRQRADLAALERRETPGWGRGRLEVRQTGSSSPCGQRGGKTDEDRQQDLQPADNTAGEARRSHKTSCDKALHPLRSLRRKGRCPLRK